MFVQEALRQILIGNSGVNALVVGRVYPGVLAQTLQDYPAVAYRLVRRTEDTVLESSPIVTGLTESSFIFYSVAKGTNGPTIAARVDAAINACLQGFSGEVVLTGSSPVSSIHIQGVFLEGSEDHYDDITQTHQVASVYVIKH